MSTLAKKKFTFEEYLALDRESDQKHEFLDGQVFAMAGGNERHNLIVTNLLGELRTQLKKRLCKIYPSDMRVKIPRTGLYTYPDVVVVCGKAEFEDEKNDTLLNPTVLVEVLSESTEAYDRGEKFKHYRRIESLQEYLLVSQNGYGIEQFIKQTDGRWLLSEESGHESMIKLSSINCELSLTEIYDKVTFENP